MFSSKRFAILALVALGTWLTVSACSLKGDACIRMSDCADGFYCNEGTCLSINGSSASDVTSSSSDASVE